MRQLALMALALSIVAAGCGPSDAEKAAQQAAADAQAAAKSTEQAAKSAEQGAKQAAQGLEAMAKGLEAMAGGAAGAGGVKPVDPVSFRDLQTFFPDLDGWDKEKPTGERMTAPFSFSQAEVRYRKGDSRIEMKLVDSGFNQIFFAPFAMMMQAGYEKETQSGYEKSTTVAGMPGWEKWNTEGKDGEVNAFVGKRFLLTIEGDNIDDIKALHAMAAKIDMNKLAALK